MAQSAAFGMRQQQQQQQQRKRQGGDGKPLASDALPLPVGLTNKIFMVLFFSASYYLMRRWREKIRNSTPLHMINMGEIAAILVQLASFIYLIGFFGIEYVQNFISKGADGAWEADEYHREAAEHPSITCQQHRPPPPPTEPKQDAPPALKKDSSPLTAYGDDELALAVSNGEVASHTLEAELGDCERAAAVRRAAVELTAKRSLDGMPIAGMDYSKILGQCCEMVIGYVQIPVGVAGPLLLDGFEYTVPMATTEGCLVASTNRGCKAIAQSGGAQSVVTRDGMTRAPVVRFESAKRAAELKWFLEDAENFDTMSVLFNRSSRFARLQSVYAALAGRCAHLRFNSTTGDAMGMNMISKGVQNVLSYLQSVFPDMEYVSVSGNYCSDKKATAVNWIEGRGKSVVCETVLKEHVVHKVLKTTVSALVQLNTIKNLTGSALAGALGGFNAHASNIVSAVFIATGQDPAQNVESSQCMTLVEAVNDGRDVHFSVTMPSIEVGTVGGGTQLPSQAACLNLLGVKGAHLESPGANAVQLARVVSGAVLAGEISLLSALASHHLVKSHLKYNRSSQNLAGAAALPPVAPQVSQSSSLKHRTTLSSKSSASFAVETAF